VSCGTDQRSAATSDYGCKLGVAVLRGVVAGLNVMKLNFVFSSLTLVFTLDVLTSSNIDSQKYRMSFFSYQTVPWKH
jgi:hypothetical protein